MTRVVKTSGGSMAGLVALTVAFALPCGCGGPTAPSSDHTPQFSIESDLLPFGVIPLTEQTLEIPFANRGDAPLHVNSISASCSCTIAESTRDVEPGGRGTISLRLHVAAPGPGSARIVLWSNDANSPHNFTVNWFGEHPPQVAPSQISAQVEAGRSFERDVSVVYAGGDPDQPLRVLAARVSNPLFELSSGTDEVTSRYNRFPGAQNQVAVAGKIAYVLRCPTLMEAGDVTGDVQFEVEQAGTKYDLKLPVQITVLGPIQCLPAALVLTGASPGALVGSARRLTVIVSEGDDVEVVQAPDFLECTIDGPESSAGARATKVFHLDVRVAHVPSVGAQPSPIRLRTPTAEVVVPVDIMTVEQ